MSYSVAGHFFDAADNKGIDQLLHNWDSTSALGYAFGMANLDGEHGLFRTCVNFAFDYLAAKASLNGDSIIANTWHAFRGTEILGEDMGLMGKAALFGTLYAGVDQFENHMENVAGAEPASPSDQADYGLLGLKHVPIL